MPADLALTPELRYLAYAALLSILIWIPYVLAEITTRGLKGAVGYPTGFYDDLPAWAQRWHRAHMNLVENLLPFAALVLVAEFAGVAGELTALGARLFFWARVVQIVVHVLGIPWLRTLAFFAGWVGNLLIFWAIVS